MRKPLRATLVGAASATMIAGGAVLIPANAVTTITFNDTTLQSRDLNGTTFARAGEARRQGAVVGYSVMRGKEVGGDVTLNGAYALTGGTINFRFPTADLNANTITGRVIGGSGNFEDATGSIEFAGANNNTIGVRIVVAD